MTPHLHNPYYYHALTLTKYGSSTYSTGIVRPKDIIKFAISRCNLNSNSRLAII